MESIKTSVNASQSILVSVRFKGDGVPRLGDPNKVLWGMVIDSLHESLRICRHCSLSNFFEPQRPTIRILHWPARWAVLSVSDPKVFFVVPCFFQMLSICEEQGFLSLRAVCFASQWAGIWTGWFSLWFASLLLWSFKLRFVDGCGWFYYLSYLGDFLFLS